MHFDKPTYLVRKTRKKDIPKGIYTKDPATGETVFNKEVEDNHMVVPKSGHHFPIGARVRIARLLDPDSFEELDAMVKSSDPLHFVDSQTYPDRIKRYEKDSGLPEAVICGTGKIHGLTVSVAVMDFRFCGGAMGAAAGKKSRGPSNAPRASASLASSSVLPAARACRREFIRSCKWPRRAPPSDGWRRRACRLFPY